MAEPPSSEVTQKGIKTSGGDVAGGDIDKSLNLYFHPQYNGESYLGRLYEQLSTEIKAERKIENTCDILNDFVATEENEVVGLEAKLERGGMSAQVDYAKECKEQYAKNLTRYAMYETAQVIHAYLLGKVQSGYAASVLPVLSKLQPEKKFELMRKAVLDGVE